MSYARQHLEEAARIIVQSKNAAPIADWVLEKR
jgi:hypothetical protein